ncbi:SLA/LP autoantigen-like protein [Trypanosoma rangeli]|uniref:O-phosphoseryl-tRNA(Sec) selenium transferase n=1 Tax=Trypanosoma rangeli TaxID=5698 RepID=A0A3R7N0G5_TRYRA|nr:SLA/LP autoantigen-like protein [Trypanosoma rangeli]RNE97981.1 SLA/LP autoantigen-like protein [Trypanosoma rangeli]|eukprot:RNE97981.1 SLA/LP autoantigen-like protein [Trypanosoma rangeli]
MNERALSLAEGFVAARYIRAGGEALRANERVVRSILAQRRCPEQGMSDVAIESLLHQLALMDTNNFPTHVGAGEREGRVVVPLVARRHYGFAHGIGRSGDILSDQPKAAGSSLIHKLTNCMALDLLRLAGAPSIESAVVFPMATGMTLSLVLRALALQWRDARRKENAEMQVSFSEDEPRCVIWTRIDQKTALKCIEAAGFVPEVVELRHAPLQRHGKGSARKGGKFGLHPYFLQVHLDDISAAIGRVGGPERVLCVLSTTSCFAPRLPDDVLAIARLCKVLNVPYVVNNAYGVQSRVIMQRLDTAMQLGRVDAMVQSGDKNFLVPVGGAVLSGKTYLVERAAALYAGRASISPVMDLFITALSLGRCGFQQLWESRYKVFGTLQQRLRRFAKVRGEILLDDEGEDYTAALPPCPACVRPRNDISLAVSMHTVGGAANAKAIGARLFRSAVTGPRVIVPDQVAKPLCGLPFRNYGMHTDEVPPCPMLVMACGIGMTLEEVHKVMQRLETVWPPPPAVAAAGARTEGEWIPPKTMMATAAVPLLKGMEAEAPLDVDVYHDVDDEDEEEDDDYEAEVMGNDVKSPCR